MKHARRRFVLLRLAAVLCCAGGMARGDDNRNHTLTLDPCKNGWKVTVTVPAGWAGKTARVKRPRLPGANHYSVTPRPYSWDALPGDSVYPPGPDGSPVALLWTPTKGKPVCVISLGFFWVREDAGAKGKTPAQVQGETRGGVLPGVADCGGQNPRAGVWVLAGGGGEGGEWRLLCKTMDGLLRRADP